MNIDLITSESHSRRLLLLFLGWGMDSHPFATLNVADCDVAVAYDYTSAEPEEAMALLSAYDELMIAAWSFGVIAADRFIASHPDLPITLRLAINGTLHPVHDTCGIPTAIFTVTLDGLSEASLGKFRLRMCGGASAATAFLASPPQRELQSLRDELTAIASMAPAFSRWDEAIVSAQDRIIPPGNQKRAWEEAGVKVSMVTGPHLPDFAGLLASRVVDKGLVARRFSKASSTYESNASVQLECATRLSELWQRHHVDESGGYVIEAGAGTGLFTKLYQQWLKTDRLSLWDIAEVNPSLPGDHKVCDAETEIGQMPDASVSAVVSASVIQWFSSPAGFINECGRVTQAGGLLAVATYGAENYRELGPSGYPSLDTLRKWAIEAGYDILEAEEQLKEIEFESARELLQHMRLTGVNARVTGSSVSQARSIIRDNLRRLTYHTLILVARKKL